MKKKEKKNKLPILNILWASKWSEDDKVLAFLNLRYNVNVLDVNNLEINPDMVVYTGGEDVSPGYYGEEVGNKTKINTERDEAEHKIFRSFRYVPSLGICRGSQFLAVEAGAKLIQHVEGHNKGSHLITADVHGYEYNIPSTHHQMMNPYNLNKEKYSVIAWSSYFKSPIYLNGKNEPIDLKPDFLEPEIVYFNNINSLAIQGHPEYSTCDTDTRDYCLNLIEKYLIKKENKEK